MIIKNKDQVSLIYNDSKLAIRGIHDNKVFYQLEEILYTDWEFAWVSTIPRTVSTSEHEISVNAQQLRYKQYVRNHVVVKLELETRVALVEITNNVTYASINTNILTIDKNTSANTREIKILPIYNDIRADSSFEITIVQQAETYSIKNIVLENSQNILPAYNDPITLRKGTLREYLLLTANIQNGSGDVVANIDILSVYDNSVTDIFEIYAGINLSARLIRQSEITQNDTTLYTSLPVRTITNQIFSDADSSTDVSLQLFYANNLTTPIYEYTFMFSKNEITNTSLYDFDYKRNTRTIAAEDSVLLPDAKYSTWFLGGNVRLEYTYTSGYTETIANDNTQNRVLYTISINGSTSYNVLLQEPLAINNTTQNVIYHVLDFDVTVNISTLNLQLTKHIINLTIKQEATSESTYTLEDVLFELIANVPSTGITVDILNILDYINVVCTLINGDAERRSYQTSNGDISLITNNGVMQINGFGVKLDHPIYIKFLLDNALTNDIPALTVTTTGITATGCVVGVFHNDILRLSIELMYEKNTVTTFILNLNGGTATNSSGVNITQNPFDTFHLNNNYFIDYSLEGYTFSKPNTSTFRYEFLGWGINTTYKYGDNSIMFIPEYDGDNSYIHSMINLEELICLSHFNLVNILTKFGGRVIIGQTVTLYAQWRAISTTTTTTTTTLPPKLYVYTDYSQILMHPYFPNFIGVVDLEDGSADAIQELAQNDYVLWDYSIWETLDDFDENDYIVTYQHISANNIDHDCYGDIILYKGSSISGTMQIIKDNVSFGSGLSVGIQVSELLNILNTYLDACLHILIKYIDYPKLYVNVTDPTHNIKCIQLLAKNFSILDVTHGQTILWNYLSWVNEEKYDESDDIVIYSNYECDVNVKVYTNGHIHSNDTVAIKNNGFSESIGLNYSKILNYIKAWIDVTIELEVLSIVTTTTTTTTTTIPPKLYVYTTYDSNANHPWFANTIEIITTTEGSTIGHMVIPNEYWVWDVRNITDAIYPITFFAIQNNMILGKCRFTLYLGSDINGTIVKSTAVIDIVSNTDLSTIYKGDITYIMNVEHSDACLHLNIMQLLYPTLTVCIEDSLPNAGITHIMALNLWSSLTNLPMRGEYYNMSYLNWIYDANYIDNDVNMIIDTDAQLCQIRTTLTATPINGTGETINKTYTKLIIPSNNLYSIGITIQDLYKYLIRFYNIELKITVLSASWNVTFYPNGGTWNTPHNQEPKVITYINNDILQTPSSSSLTRSGYTFIGWSETENGSLVDTNIWITSKPYPNLYAQWAVNTTTTTTSTTTTTTTTTLDVITYYPVGGTWEDGTTGVKVVNAVIGDTYVVPMNITRGYMYITRWTKSTNISDLNTDYIGTLITSTSPRKLYALWHDAPKLYLYTSYDSSIHPMFLNGIDSVGVSGEIKLISRPNYYDLWDYTLWETLNEYDETDNVCVYGDFTYDITVSLHNDSTIASPVLVSSTKRYNSFGQTGITAKTILDALKTYKTSLCLELYVTSCIPPEIRVYAYDLENILLKLTIGDLGSTDLTLTPYTSIDWPYISWANEPNFDESDKITIYAKKDTDLNVFINKGISTSISDNDRHILKHTYTKLEHMTILDITANTLLQYIRQNITITLVLLPYGADKYVTTTTTTTTTTTAKPKYLKVLLHNDTKMFGMDFKTSIYRGATPNDAMLKYTCASLQNASQNSTVVDNLIQSNYTIYIEPIKIYTNICINISIYGETQNAYVKIRNTQQTIINTSQTPTSIPLNIINDIAPQFDNYDNIIIDILPEYYGPKYVVQFDSNSSVALGTPPSSVYAYDRNAIPLYTPTTLTYTDNTFRGWSSKSRNDSLYETFRIARFSETSESDIFGNGPAFVQSNWTYLDYETYTNGKFIDEKDDDHTYTLTLYAQWEYKEWHLLKFDLNGGSGIEPNAILCSSLYSDVTIYDKFPTMIPVKGNLLFRGWSNIKEKYNSIRYMHDVYRNNDVYAYDNSNNPPEYISAGVTLYSILDYLQMDLTEHTHVLYAQYESEDDGIQISVHLGKTLLGTANYQDINNNDISEVLFFKLTTSSIAGDNEYHSASFNKSSDNYYDAELITTVKHGTFDITLHALDFETYCPTNIENIQKNAPLKLNYISVNNYIYTAKSLTPSLQYDTYKLVSLQLNSSTTSFDIIVYYYVNILLYMGIGVLDLHSMTVPCTSGNIDSAILLYNVFENKNISINSNDFKFEYTPTNAYDEMDIILTYTSNEINSTVSTPIIQYKTIVYSKNVDTDNVHAITFKSSYFTQNLTNVYSKDFTIYQETYSTDIAVGDFDFVLIEYNWNNPAEKWKDMFNNYKVYFQAKLMLDRCKKLYNGLDLDTQIYVASEANLPEFNVPISSYDIGYDQTISSYDSSSNYSKYFLYSGDSVLVNDGSEYKTLKEHVIINLKDIFTNEVKLEVVMLQRSNEHPEIVEIPLLANWADDSINGQINVKYNFYKRNNKSTPISECVLLIKSLDNTSSYFSIKDTAVTEIETTNNEGTSTINAFNIGNYVITYVLQYNIFTLGAKLVLKNKFIGSYRSVHANTVCAYIQNVSINRTEYANNGILLTFNMGGSIESLLNENYNLVFSYYIQNLYGEHPEYNIYRISSIKRPNDPDSGIAGTSFNLGFISNVDNVTNYGCNIHQNLGKYVLEIPNVVLNPQTIHECRVTIRLKCDSIYDSEGATSTLPPTTTTHAPLPTKTIYFMRDGSLVFIIIVNASYTNARVPNCTDNGFLYWESEYNQLYIGDVIIYENIENEEIYNATYLTKTLYFYSQEILVDTIIINRGETKYAPKAPFRAGYNFIKWDGTWDLSENALISYENVINNDIYTAEWLLISTTTTTAEPDVISYYPNSGTWADGSIEVKSIPAVDSQGQYLKYQQPMEISREGYTLSGWYAGSLKYSNGSSIGPKNITPRELTAIWTLNTTTTTTVAPGSYYNGYEYVDLGITADDGTPLMFATCNIGANSPEEYGDYFMWGSTTPNNDSKCYWDDPNLPYQTENTTSSGSTKWTKYLGSTTSSYKDSSATDEDALKTELDLLDDAACVIMGGKWRMPTSYELQRLYEMTNTWTTLNGVNGRKWTAVNGDTLFIPAAGYRNNGAIRYQGTSGYVWSSSLTSYSPNSAWYMSFYVQGNGANNIERCYGLSIRGVFSLSSVTYGTYLGINYVNLGLTDDDGNFLCIATCNIGATSPEEYGDYFMWASTTPNNEDNCAPAGPNVPYHTGTLETTGWTKYIVDDDTNVDDDVILSLNDDAAHVIMGGKWRMPTMTELQRLSQLTNTWTTLNGVYGRKWTGDNGTSLFIPAAGYRRGEAISNASTYSYIWSSNLFTELHNRAYYMYFNSSNIYALNKSSRCFGLSIRGVFSLTSDIYHYINGYEYVDLGITTSNGASLYFAACNIGANLPEEYGDYFMWASTTPNNEDKCYWDDPKLPYQTANTTSSYLTKWTKYLGSTTSSYSDRYAADEDAIKTVLSPNDDAAHVIMGGNWRMPTASELQSLSDLSNMWTTLNGVYGRKWTSYNGSTLFIPAAGYRNNGVFKLQGSSGNVWSSSLYVNTPYDACNMFFDNNYIIGSDSINRCTGISIRAVIVI